MKQVDILIIGAGITGLAIARRLSRFKLSIAVVEKEPDVAMGATKANSAIVHGGYAENYRKLKGSLCYQGRKQFESLNQELHFGYEATGSLVITSREENLPALRRLLDNGRQNGLDDLSIIGRDKIRALEPNINPDAIFALYCQGAGICSPYGMAIALAENAVENGLELYLNQPVTAIKCCRDDHINQRFLVSTVDYQFSTSYVINCSGKDAASVSSLLYEPPYTINTRTGEYLVFQRGSGKLMNQVVFQMPTKMGKGILVTPTVHDNLIIGPDAINEAGEPDRSTHKERLAAIYDQARLTIDKLDPSQVIRSFSGVRAVSSTDDFIIEMSPVFGLVEVAGIQSPGLTASPAIADRIEEILRDAGLKLTEKTHYQAERLPLPEITNFRPMSEIVEKANLPPGPERIICRCEQVCEQVILDCARRGLPITTVDAVKRRTRAGMGICQGSFCRSRVTSLLKQISSLPVDGLTDVQRDSLSRVTREQFITYLKSRDN